VAANFELFLSLLSRPYFHSQGLHKVAITQHIFRLSLVVVRSQQQKKKKEKERLAFRIMQCKMMTTMGQQQFDDILGVPTMAAEVKAGHSSLNNKRGARAALSQAWCCQIAAPLRPLHVHNWLPI
jgi:hypothetical protein